MAHQKHQDVRKKCANNEKKIYEVRIVKLKRRGVEDRENRIEARKRRIEVLKSLNWNFFEAVENKNRERKRFQEEKRKDVIAKKKGEGSV